MNTALITAASVIAVAAITALGTYAASRASSRSNTQAALTAAQLEERKVNREDFEAITKQLWASICDLTSRLDTETKARQAAEERAEQAEDRAAAAKTKADALEQRVDQLEAALEAAHVPIPPASS